MIWQRLALLAVAAGMLLALAMRGRHDGKRSVVTAFSMDKQPVGWVQITGAVRHSGTYPVYDKSMTISVIKMSEPLCVLDDNAAEVVRRLQTGRGWVIDVQCMPAQERGLLAIRPLPAAQCLVLGLPLSLNGATFDELQVVPGIGPHLAQRIIVHRQKNGDFGSLEELGLLEGIAEKKLEKLRPYLTL